MTIRVTLEKNSFGIVFDLIQVTDIYRMDNDRMYQSFTENDLMFMVGNIFCMNEYSKICTIPKTLNKSRSYTTFKTEDERYDFLKTFHEALLEWSNFRIFHNKKVFTDKPNIKFHKNVWIVF